MENHADGPDVDGLWGDFDWNYGTIFWSTYNSFSRWINDNCYFNLYGFIIVSGENTKNGIEIVL